MPEPLEPERTVDAPGRDPNASDASDRDETATTTPRAGSAAPTFGPPAAAGEVGTLGPYRVVKQLGVGGMGAVYLAVDTRLDRKLALKVMLPEFAADRDAKERFLREARAAAKITHDNVVIVHEADEREGVPYIAMQFLQGYPLDEYLKTKGTPPLAHVIRIGRETALGLAAAHAMGLVHRDIKPANLWLEAPNGRVKVLDFGLAKPVGTDTELTKSGAVVGTPAYMSPEQARGVKVDHRTDLFSLGCVLYRLCTGKTPFAGPNVMAVMMALGNDDPTPVRELNPSVPEALAELIHQLLAKKPEARPQTANEVAKRLRTTLDQLLAPPPTAVASSGSVPTVSAADLSASQPVVVHPVPHQPPIVVPMHVTAAPEDAFANLEDEADTATAAAAESAPAVPKPERRKGGKGLLLAVGAAVLLAGVAAAVVVSQMDKKGEPVAEQKPPVVQTPPKDDGKPPAGSIPVLKPVGTEWVDVLALDEKLFDAAGQNLVWAKRNGKWTSPVVLGQWISLRLPVRATGSFNVVAEVSLESGSNAFAIRVPVGPNRTVGLNINDGAGTVRGFSTIRGLPPHHEQNPTRTPQNPVPVARVVKIAVTVKVADEQVELQATVDNDPPIRWAGPASDIVYDPPGSRLVQVFAQESQWTVHSLKFQKIDGEAAILEWGPPGSDPDRKAAEWVLSGGGTVKVNGEDRNIQTAGELPKGSFALTEVNLWGNKAATDAGLASLKDCKNLTYLHVGGSSVTDAGLEHLKELKNLAVLYLNVTNVTDAGLEHLKTCKSLTTLSVKQTKVTLKGLEAIHAAVPGCRIEHDGVVIEPKVVADPDRKAAEWVIAQGGSVRVKEVDGEIKAAADLPKDRFALTHVIVGGMQVTDAGLEHLKGLKNLKHLGLYDVPVTDAGLVHIKELTTLTELIVGGAKVTGSGLIHLKNLTALTNVTLVRGPLTDAGLAHLKELKGLRTLSLEWTKVTDTGLEHIKELKSLTNLSLFGTAVTDAGLVHLKELRSLEALWLTGTKVSDAGLAQLKELKSLTVLELGQTAVTGAGLAHLKDLKSLMNLGLGGASVSDVGLVHLQELKNLTFLTLGSTNVSDAGLADVKELKALTFLDLR